MKNAGLFALVFLGCVQLSIFGHAVKATKTELRTLFDNGCPLRYEYERMNCTRWTEYIKLRKLIPFGETCTLQVNDHELNVTCTEALSIYDHGLGERSKRSFAAIGGYIGGHFGPVGLLVGSLSGLVVDLIICTFFCSNGHKEPNSAPLVTKPAALNQANPVIAATRQKTAHVSWSGPLIRDKEDNADLTVTVTPLQSGALFTKGSYTIYFSAKDSGGRMAQTSLSFEVKVISCEPVTTFLNGHVECDLLDNIMGTNCTVHCKPGYSSDNINKDLEWQWDANSLKPFCKETNCTQLREPKNGAIACSEWTYGQMCLMMCQKGFDVPANIDGQFVCGTSTGLWRPSHIVPDCNVAVNPDIMNLPSEFYYYTDKCNSSTENIFEIQHNFINALNTSKYLEFCTSNPDCQAQFVSISCGPTSRKKRDTNVYRRATLQFAYIVDFEISLAYHSLPNETDNQAMDRISSMLDNIAESIHIATSNGAFDIAGLVVEADSFASGIPSVKCPPGTIARSAMSTCVGCPIGQYLSNRTRTCIECPHGSYQDSPNSINCTPCPSLTNTTGIGSSKIEDCRAPCLPGEYSPTGLVPCAKCPSSAFQPVPSSIVCSPCPSGTRAPTEGATSVLNCTRYDVQTKTGFVVYNNASAREITISTWIVIKSNLTTDNSISIIAPTTNQFELSLAFSPGNVVVVTIMSDIVCKSNASIQLHSWTHLALAIGIQNLVVYLNGNEICSNLTVTLERSTVLTADDRVVFRGEMYLSDFHVVPYKSSFSDVQQSAKSCIMHSSSLYTIDNLAQIQDAQIVVPSLCDATDECSSKPCGQHEFDGQWSYWTEWSVCTHTCGGGTRSKTRACVSPPPEPEGLDCEGESIVSEACNTDKCPECSALRRPYGVEISCNESVEIKSCTLTCRPGLYFAEPPLPVYECGISTGYKWNHQNTANPTAILPSCSEVKAPSHMKVSLESHYETLDCNEKNIDTINTQIEIKLKQLECVKDEQCQIDIQNEECHVARLKRASENGLSLVVDIHSDVLSTNNVLDVAAVLGNNSAPSDALVHFVKKTFELERAAQTIANNSVDFFQVTIDGVQHTVKNGTAGLRIGTSITCPKGSVRLEVFCAECPVGTYSDGRTVIMCPIGQYQDEKGQSECKVCPRGRTTPGIGSIQASDCSIQLDDLNGDGEKTTGGSGSYAVALGAGLAGGLVAFALLSVGGLVSYKHITNKKRRVSDSQIMIQMPNYALTRQPIFG
ncbi:hypothetical protein DPMN_072941 [Dreissena polymorpha]|uniref:Tyrosine-protein kinase ephrin type A/B receptor-like domain-containing protein n=1 Tax=Dreissena polymorpha TaxID=45954 RepID=A0A9D4BY82_DREPO|nr:hypothetical protein DPMN_072941 [Dreissena polymorpha]